MLIDYVGQSASIERHRSDIEKLTAVTSSFAVIATIGAVHRTGFSFGPFSGGVHRGPWLACTDNLPTREQNVDTGSKKRQELLQTSIIIRPIFSTIMSIKFKNTKRQLTQGLIVNNIGKSTKFLNIYAARISDLFKL